MADSSAFPSHYPVTHQSAVLEAFSSSNGVEAPVRSHSIPYQRSWRHRARTTRLLRLNPALAFPVVGNKKSIKKSKMSERRTRTSGSCGERRWPRALRPSTHTLSQGSQAKPPNSVTRISRFLGFRDRMQYEQPDEMNNTHALDSRQAWPVIPVCSDNLSRESVIGPSSTAPSQIRSQTSGMTRDDSDLGVRPLASYWGWPG
jgi:hypothetical protein